MYEVTVYCPDCEGEGVKSFQHSLSGNPETAVTISEIDCPECDGKGKINIKEATELYENTQDLLKDDAYIMGKIPEVKAKVNLCIDRVKTIRYLCEESIAGLEELKEELTKL